MCYNILYLQSNDLVSVSGVFGMLSLGCLYLYVHICLQLSLPQPGVSESTELLGEF